MADENQKESDNYEKVSGLTLAVFAAILAVTDLGGGRYGGDEILASAEKSNMYAWYQAKSVKASLASGEKDLLESLILSGTIRPEQVVGIQKHISELDQNIARYKKEKKEILLGSSAVGRENWAQAKDGELGQIVGAREWQKTADELGAAGDYFDLGTLFLQICLVLGAIGLVVHGRMMNNGFFWTMVVLGLIGTIYSVMAFNTVGVFG